MASVKLDVYDNNINSLISIANAMNAPQVSLNAKVKPVGATGSTLTESANSHNAWPSKHLKNKIELIERHRGLERKQL